MQHKISVDAMGGDFGPSVTIPASLKILKKYENISIVLVGNSDEIIQILKKKNHSTILESQFIILLKLLVWMSFLKVL